METNEQPCPHRILDYGGGGFFVGAFGIPYFAFVGALYSQPGKRLIESVHQVKRRTPVLMGNFGAYGTVFAAFLCSTETARGKSDPWNMVLTLGATRGIFAIRAGPRAALMRTAEGMLLGGFLELNGIFLNKYFVADADRPPRASRDDHEGIDNVSADPVQTDSPPLEAVEDMKRVTEPASSSEPSLRLWLAALTLAATAKAVQHYRAPLSRAASQGMSESSSAP